MKRVMMTIAIMIEIKYTNMGIASFTTSCGPVTSSLFCVCVCVWCVCGVCECGVCECGVCVCVCVCVCVVCVCVVCVCGVWCVCVVCEGGG